MRRKLVALALLSLAGIATAGETAVDVPVTIQNIGGCSIVAPSSVDLGTVATRDGNVPLNPVAFSVRCTDGVQYDVRLGNAGWSYNSIELQSGNNVFRIQLYKDAARTQRIQPNDSITTGTGNGQEQQITIYTMKGELHPVQGMLPGCGWNNNCQPGTYTGTMQIKVIW